MATLVLKDASTVINGVDLSDHVKSVAISSKNVSQDDTAMGDSAQKSKPGLREESMKITFLQDFAASKVDATLNGLYSGGTSHTVVVKPTSAAVSATNPSYTLTGYIEDYPPIGGSVGEMLTTDVTWMNGAGAGIARAVA